LVPGTIAAPRVPRDWGKPRDISNARPYRDVSQTALEAAAIGLNVSGRLWKK
jgi:hypothetical protein